MLPFAVAVSTAIVSMTGFLADFGLTPEIAKPTPGANQSALVGMRGRQESLDKTLSIQSENSRANNIRSKLAISRAFSLLVLWRASAHRRTRCTKPLFISLGDALCMHLANKYLMSQSTLNQRKKL